MNKVLLLFVAVAMTCSQAFAQLPDGSTAPDFTVTDINGNTHTLSDYLNDGKTVIMDVSATWCGPCWSYHNSHALADLYNSYGPNGSDEVVVLFVEGDGSTTQDDLEGTTSGTQGNWIEGTPYPIIDDANLASLYQIAYFPTIYRICPDGLVYEAGQADVAGLLSQISNDCGQSVTGATDHGQMADGEAALCTSEGDVTASFDNFGTNAITSATFELFENGSSIESSSFSGNVAQFGSDMVTFSGVMLNESASYEVKMTDINGNTPANPSLTEGAVSVSVAGVITNKEVTVNFFTDNYPGETEWAILDNDDNVIASGGPYTPGTDDQWGGGGPDANTTMTTTHELPGSADCYKVRLFDSFADGQQYGTSPNPDASQSFGIQVLDNEGNEVLNWGPGSGFEEIVKSSAIRSDAVSTVTELSSNSFAIYPNPAKGFVNVNFDGSLGNLELTITDLQGRDVYTGTLYNNASISTNEFAAGSYIVSLKAENGSSTRTRLVIVE